MSRSSSSVGKRLAGQVRHLRRLLVQHLHADDEVADQLALVGVAEDAAVAQLADLADVVQEDAHQQQVAVQLGIERQQAVGRVEQGDDVLQQAAEVGVMVADAGRHLAEIARRTPRPSGSIRPGPAGADCSSLQQHAAQPLAAAC